MQLDRLPDRLSSRVDRVRDRTAEAMGSDSGSVLREITRLGRKLEGTEQHLADRLETLADVTRDTDDRIDGLETKAGTTWPRRLFWIMVGMGAGTLAAYLADPERGDQRREELKGQAQQRVQSVSGDVSERARALKEQAATRAQGVKDQAAASSRNVADETQHAVEDVKSEAQRAVVDVRDEAQKATEDLKQDVGSRGSSGSPAPASPPPPGRSM